MGILVTGSTGFIGEKICLKLAGKGYKVHALYRSEGKTAGIMHPHIKLFKGDIMDETSLERAIKGCRQLYHTAAFTEVWARDPVDIYRLNVLGTLKVLDAALNEGIRDIVITSTAGILGPSYNGQVNEDSIPPGSFFTEYERTKAIGEMRASDYIRNGLNIRFVNPTRVFGPGRLSQSNSVTRIIYKYAGGRWRIIPGNGNQTGNYAFIDDVVEGHILCMEKGKTGERYILGGHDISYNDFFQKLAKACGKKRQMIKVPLPAMQLLAKGASLTCTLAGIKPFITTGLVNKFNHHWKVSSQKACRELGYSITPFNEALKKTLDNYPG